MSVGPKCTHSLHGSWVSLGWNKGSSRAAGTQDLLPCSLVFGRIHFPVDVGLRALFSCHLRKAAQSLATWPQRQFVTRIFASARQTGECLFWLSLLQPAGENSLLWKGCLITSGPPRITSFSQWKAPGSKISLNAHSPTHTQRGGYYIQMRAMGILPQFCLPHWILWVI